MKILLLAVLLGCVVVGSGCVSSSGADRGLSYHTPMAEASWILNGEPLEFEGDLWYPTDEVERLLDHEMFAKGTSRDTTFFIERTDVKPYDRLYTYFGKNRYRAFEKKS